MKLFIAISLILLGIAQFSWAQEQVHPSMLNAMSNVFGLTAEGGVTFGITDYSISKLNFNAKGSIEYYLPSKGMGNFGLRIFGQSGFVSGRGVPDRKSVV